MCLVILTVENKNTEIEIMHNHGSRSGYDKSDDFQPTAKIMCDMQPFSGGLALKEYGLEVDCVKRIYCDPCEHLLEGEGVAVDGVVRYTVTYVEHWEAYAMALLKKR